MSPRPTLPPDQKRVPVTHKIAPATRERLAALAAATGLSQGEVIDEAVAAYKPKRKRG